MEHPDRRRKKVYEFESLRRDILKQFRRTKEEKVGLAIKSLTSQNEQRERKRTGELE